MMPMLTILRNNIYVFFVLLCYVFYNMYFRIYPERNIKIVNKLSLSILLDFISLIALLILYRLSLKSIKNENIILSVSNVNDS